MTGNDIVQKLFAFADRIEQNANFALWSFRRSLRNSELSKLSPEFENQVLLELQQKLAGLKAGMPQ